MADHNKPTLTSPYADFVSELDGRLDDLAVGLDPAVTTVTNVPTNTIRWSSAASTWQKWNGTAWVALSASYAINLAGPATVVANSTGDALRITQTGTGNALVVEDAASPDASPFVIDAGGAVIAGYTSRFSTIDAISLHSVGTTSQLGFSAYNWNSSGVSRLAQYKSNSGTVGTYGAVASGNELGRYQFFGDDGADFREGVRITATVDATPATGSMPGRLVFSTTRTGSSTPTEAMRIDSNQSVRITNSTASDALRITQTGTGNSFVVEDSTSPDSTPFVIDADGRVVQGAASVFSVDDGVFNSQILAGGGAGQVIARFTNSAAGPVAYFAKSRSASVSGQGVLNSGDSLGELRFGGSDGTSILKGGAIVSQVDGAPGTGSMPGRLTFNTTAPGSSTPTERTRIDSAGRLRHFGTTIVSNVDMLAASYDGVSFSIAGQDTTPQGVFFSPDGRKMFVMGSGTDRVFEYTLSTPWLVSSATVGSNLLVSGQDASPQGLFFRADGLKMYVIGTANDTVFQYALTTPWSIATASYESKAFSVTTEDTNPTGVFFKPDGLSMYVTGGVSDAVHQYTLTTAWDVTTASLTRSFSVVGQETSPQDVSFTADGTRMFVLGSTGDDVTVYNLTIPWDISTASHIGQFSVASQDTLPAGFYLKPDGTKFYMCGQATDTVYQYTVPSVEIQLTGQTAINGGATVAENLTVNGGLVVASSQTPASASAAGTTGQIVWDASYVYVCVATNTWKRSALSSW